MTTVERLFQRYSCPSESQQLCDELAPLLGNGSPDPVKCTKRLYNTFVSTFDDALSKPNGYETVCVLLNTLRYISNGSPALTHGFVKFISYGLLEKISSWCSSLCLSAQKLKSQPGWNKATDEILFTITVIMNHSSDVRQNMIPMLPTLLMYISNKGLPCSAKIEATRGCNTLLEECSIDHRCTVSAKPQIKKLIQEMGNLIIEAGDIELQVTMVECLFRLTSMKERSSLAQRWYRGRPALLKTFTGLRDSEFEVDCRVFLNHLNTSLGKRRTVYSLPCKRAILGTFELHRPADPGIEHFWVDFNLSSQTLAMFVEDPYARGGANPEDSMWEYVVIRRSALKHWTIEGKAGDVCLKLELVDFVHSILPNLSDTSHTIVITFGGSIDPCYPCELIFGAPKQTVPQQQQQQQQGQHRASKAIAPVHINEKRPIIVPTPTADATGGDASRNSNAAVAAAVNRQTRNNFQEISPIELPPNTPACGGQVNSQGSCTPTDQDIPTATPATSTPKPRSFQTVTPAPTQAPTSAGRTPSSSSASRGAMRPTLMFSSNGEPQSASRKASLAVNSIVLGGKSRVVTTAQTTPLKTGRSAAENSKLMQKVAHEQAMSTTAKQSTGSKSQAKPQAEQSKRMNELNTKKIDVQAKQPSKLSTKKTQKSTAAVKKTIAPPAQPPPSKAAEPKVASKKVLSRESTATKPTTCTKSKSATAAPPVNNKKSMMMKKGRYQIPDSPDPDPYDIPSPVLDYTEENFTTAAAPKKQHNTSQSCVSGGSRQSVNGTSKSTLSDVTNQSYGATQLNRGGQHRVFNLSAAPQKKGGKNGRGKNGRNSASSSLSSSPCLADDVNAIPDSMPACGQSSEKALAYTSFLDDELDLRPPTTTTSKQRKRVRVPTDSNSFDFDSDNESDLSWKVSEGTRRGKIAASKPPPAKKRQYKAKATKEKPKPMLTSARTKKVATDKKEQSIKAIAKSKATTSTTKTAKKPDEDMVKKTRPPAGTTLLGRKRAIDDVYDPDFTPEFNCPKPKVTAAPAPAAKKAVPKKKVAPSTVAAKTTEEPARETPSLPSMKKDAAARKLVMIQDSPQKQSGARKRVEVTKEAAGKKKQPLTTRNGKKKQSTRTVDAPCAHDDLYYSPAIPRVSASKPDLAERAQSHSKPRSLKQPPPELDLHSPELDLHGDDDALICPPSPKKPRLQQRAGRRSSGYFSDTRSRTPTSSPGYSDHDDSLIELQDNVKTNLQFVEDGREHSSCSSSPSISCPPSPPPPPPPRRQPPNSKLPSLPASPTSLHSSQVEADLNITANFEEICRQFISRSGKAKTGQPSATTAAEARKQAVKEAKPSENVATVAKKRRREQRNHWEDEDEGRDSLPPRKVVKTQQQQQQQRSKVQATRSKKPPSTQKATQSRKKATIVRKPAPVMSEEGEEESGVESSSSGSTSEDDSDEDTAIASNKQTSRAKKAANGPVDIGSEMQAMISSFKAGLSKVVKSKQMSTEQLASKATQGELYKLWAAHQKQRTDMSSLFQQQLCQELDSLEREVKTTQGSEEKATSQLKLCFKTMTRSLHKQQSQVDRLRALQLTYQEQVEELEQNQERQRLTAQRSLKKEMHSLQKRLLENSQKQEVARIKKSLHTMLMQL